MRAPEKSQVTWVHRAGQKACPFVAARCQASRTGSLALSLLCGPLDPRGNPGDLKQENDLPVGGKQMEEEAKREPERWIRRLEPSPGSEITYTPIGEMGHALGFPRETEPMGYIYVHIYTSVSIISICTYSKWFTVWNWLIQLWRLKTPQLCICQTGDPGKPVL